MLFFSKRLRAFTCILVKLLEPIRHKTGLSLHRVFLTRPFLSKS